MKKIVLFAVILASCNNRPTQYNPDASYKPALDLTPNEKFFTSKITVDSVDYVVVKSSNGLSIIKHGVHQ